MASSRFSAVTRKPSAARRGSETPRVFTPPLCVLTPKTSWGFSVIDFATDVLGIDLMPWQRWLLVHALELRPEGGFRFRNVVVLVARQNGKSTLSQVLALWFMYVYGYDLVLGTAQDLDTAEEVWQGAVDLVTEMDDDDRPVRPDLFEQHRRTVLVNGKKSLELTTGARYKAKAASRRSGRGLSGDLVLLDELREHQNWDAWGAITKTTMARDEAMVWALSNAGDALSIVLAYLRRTAHAEIGDPDGINSDRVVPDEAEPDEDVELDDDDSLAIFEWSAPPGCDVWDRDGWAQANPALGYKISERTVASAAKTDPDAIFRTEVLCQWVESTTPAAVNLDTWPTLSDAAAPRGGQPVFGVAVGRDGDEDWAAVAVAWRRADGLAQVMLADYRPGVAWLADRVTDLRAQWGGTVLADPSAKGVLDAEVFTATAVVHNAFSAAVEAKLLRWGSTDALGDKSAALTMAVRASTWKPSGDSRVYDRSGTKDISPLIAAALALHGLTSRPSVELWGFQA